MSLKAKVEAVLFLTDKPIQAQAVAKILNEDVQVIRQTVLELIHDYEERAGALEVGQDNGYTIQVKDEYANLMEEFLPMEISIALVRTLSAIAIKQPIAQAEIIKLRGGGAYDHIKELIERDLVHKKEDGGRSPMLTTTKRFQEYFRLTRDARSLRQNFKKQEAQANQLKIGAASGESGEGSGEGTGDIGESGESSIKYMSDNKEDSFVEAVIEKLLDSAFDTGEMPDVATDRADAADRADTSDKPDQSDDSMPYSTVDNAPVS